MRLLLDLVAYSNEEHIRAVEELQKEHDIVYWIRMDGVSSIEPSRFPRTTFHNYHDAVRNVPPAAIDPGAFEPLSSSDARALSEWDTVFLIMLDKWHPQWPVTKRYDFYLEILRYWRGVLGMTAPDCVIFNGPPHNLYNLALFALAKQHGIRTILFDVTFRPDRAIASFDYRLGNESLARARDAGFEGLAVELDDLPPYIREQYQEVSGSAHPSPRHFVHFNKEHARIRSAYRRIKSLWPFIKDGSMVERLLMRILKNIRSNSRQEYERLQKAVDFNIPYIYLPLHYQPECTTSPQGGIFADQVHVARLLSAALPDRWRIYVKEHPAQWPAHLGDFTAQRYRDFYASIASLPNVQLVPVSTDSFELADHAQVTATVSGTAAWESILRGKPALVFGYPWFMHAPGIFRVSSVDECKEALKKIVGGAAPAKDHLFRYFAELDKVTFPSWLDVPPYAIRAYEPGEEWKGLYGAIVSALGA